MLILVYLKTKQNKKASYKVIFSSPKSVNLNSKSVDSVWVTYNVVSLLWFTDRISGMFIYIYWISFNFFFLLSSPLLLLPQDIHFLT